MNYLQLHLNTLREHTEVLSDFLENAEALSVSWQALAEPSSSANPASIYEPALDSTPLWQHVKITAIFAEQTVLPTLMETPGILNEQTDAVRQAYIAAGFKIIDISHQKEWVSLMGSAM